MNEMSVYFLVPTMLDIGGLGKTRVVFGVIPAFEEYEVYLGNPVWQVNSIRNHSVQLKEGRRKEYFTYKNLCSPLRRLNEGMLFYFLHIAISELKCLHEV